MSPQRRQNMRILLLLYLVALPFGCPKEETPELVRSEQEMKWLHEEWVLSHDKSYSDKSEKDKRFQIFKDNLAFIDNHNRPGNNHTYSLGLNKFADLTDEEFRSLFLGPPLNLAQIPADDVIKRHRPKKGLSLPPSVDWRRWGAVSAIKDQGTCELPSVCLGGCSGRLTKITTGRLITLSEQELIDCDYRNEGCKTGFINYSYRYIIENGGIDSDGHYPYTGVAGQCRPDKRRVARISGFRMLPMNDPYSMQYAVASRPVTVWIEAYGRSFQFYKSGVFSGPCGTAGDHFLAVIGYGVHKSGTPYWLLKNSWGTSWGEGGFAMIRRSAGGSGLCGIHKQAQYPVMGRWVGEDSE